MLLLLIGLVVGCHSVDVTWNKPSNCDLIAGENKVALDYTITNQDDLPSGSKVFVVFNGNPIEMPVQSMYVVVPELPLTAHSVYLQVVDDNKNVVKVTNPISFLMTGNDTKSDNDIGSAFSALGAREEENGFWKSASAAYFCSTRRLRVADPWIRMGHVMMMDKRYEEASRTYHHLLNFMPDEPSVNLLATIAEYVDQGHKCSGEMRCRDALDDHLSQRFWKLLNLNMSTVDAHHYIWEELGLTPSGESDLSVWMKWLWLLTECKWLREKNYQHPMQPVILRQPVDEKWSTKNFVPQNEKGKKTIVIYARQYTDELQEQWGPTVMKNKGIGGANEAVVYLSRELLKMNYHVEVYGNPGIEDFGLGEDGVYWYPYWVYNASSSPDVFMVWWHHLDAIRMGMAAKVRYVWVHYAQYYERYTPQLMDLIDGVIPLSKYHGNQMPPFSQPKVFVSANGLDPSYYIDGQNKRLQLIYASHPFYGLETLLVAWPRIKARLKDATIDIYYGWTPGVIRYLESQGERGAKFKAKLDEMMKYDGIRYRGMVGPRKLAEAIADSGFYLYPCEIAEISSISLMRAQALGAIPITSRHLDSALPETSQYDLGPPAREGLIGKNEEWLQQWIDAVVDAVGDNTGKIEAHRAEMKAWAREKFKWSHVAQQWDDWFTEHIHNKNENELFHAKLARPDL